MERLPNFTGLFTGAHVTCSETTDTCFALPNDDVTLTCPDDSVVVFRRNEILTTYKVDRAAFLPWDCTPTELCNNTKNAEHLVIFTHHELHYFSEHHGCTVVQQVKIKFMFIVIG